MNARMHSPDFDSPPLRKLSNNRITTIDIGAFSELVVLSEL
jgi:hypothetical protein